MKNGVKWTLVGHSERRSFRTTEGVIAAKARVAIEKGMNIIACIGVTDLWKSNEYSNIDKKNYTK